MELSQCSGYIYLYDKDIIDKPNEIPVDCLIMMTRKNGAESSICEVIDDNDNYKKYNARDLNYIYFINVKCDYDIYIFTSDGFYKIPDGVKEATTHFTIDKILQQYNGPFIIRVMDGIDNYYDVKLRLSFNFQHIPIYKEEIYGNTEIVFYIVTKRENLTKKAIHKK